MNKDTAQLIINKVKQDYDLIAEQFSSTRSREWFEFNEFAKYIKPNSAVLDFGCGNGRLLRFFKDKNIVYTGIDISPKLISIAKNQKNLEQLPPHEFICTDFTNLQFKKQRFDIVLAIASIYHVPSKELRLKIFQEVSRVLKKEGIFIMTYWNMWNQQRVKFVFKNILQKLLGNSQLDFLDAERPWKTPDNETVTKRYCHAFTLGEVKKLSEKVNLIPIELYYSSKDRRSNFWKGFNGILIARKRVERK